MVKNFLPYFSFKDPKQRGINIRFSSAPIIGGTRAIRAIWTPQHAQDLLAFHHIDAEDELTALLSQRIAQEIDNEIIQTFQHQNGHRAPWGEFNHPTNDPFDGLAFPLIRRVNARTMGNELVAVQPLNSPTGLLQYMGVIDPVNVEDPNYTTLPNEEGWYTDGYYESVFIKIELKKFDFLKKNTPTWNWRHPFILPGRVY